MQKVFGIGFHKTGTTTLESVLSKLGYKVCGTRRELLVHLQKNQLTPIYDLVKKYDAFEDNPWTILYKEFDQEFPGSKFILTIRDSDKWINSLNKHFSDTHSDMRKHIYGVGYPKGNERLYLDRYNQHNENVMDYFKDRPNDLIVIDWSKENGWGRICDFLNIPLIKGDLPHSNKASDRGNLFLQNIKSSILLKIKSKWERLRK